MNWRDIPGFEGSYQASDCGQIRSVDRTTEDTRGRVTHRRGRILRQTTRAGHPGVLLSVDGEARAWSTCQLVALAFVGAPPRCKAPRVIHIDGNPANNCAQNLRWSDHSEVRVIARRNLKARQDKA